MHAHLSIPASGFVARIKKFAAAHKVASSIIVVVILGVAWWAKAAFFSPAAPTRYVLASVQNGTIIASVTGSGQVSASDQVIINPKSSGAIVAVYAHDGQSVGAGQALAAIDSTDAQKAVRDAKANLAGAQLSLEKLREPADALSLTEAQNSVSSAKTDLDKTYQSGYNDVVSAFLDFSAVMNDMQTILAGTGASHGTQWNIDYYRDAVSNATNGQSLAQASAQRDATYAAYTSALSEYNSANADYQATTQNSSTSTIEAIIKETYTMSQAVATALADQNSFIQYYENTLKTHNLPVSSTADSSITMLGSDITNVNGHITTLLSDVNTITADEQSIAQNTLSLQKLQAGADPIDVASSNISVQKAQNALQDAEDALADYTVRAPFSGVLANFDLHVGDTVSGGTAIATEISSGAVADLSLNEVDAAKVSQGEKATLTFDAVPDLTLTGHVASVSPLGAVSQGVVSYDVKIAFDTQDSRVKAGMTVNAAIITAMKQNALVAPSSAIKTQGGQSYVLVVDAPPALPATSSAAGIALSSPPRQVAVTLGISNDTQIEITSGLSAGQTIVSRAISGAAQSAGAGAPSLIGGGRGGGVLRGG